MGILHLADLSLFADYYQFTVQDGGVFPDAPTDWTSDDIDRRVKVAPNVVVVCPLRNDTVPVQVEVHDRAPQIDLDGYDHAVRASLDLPTGILQIHECTGGERLRLTLAPGPYAVLALFSGLETIDEAQGEGEDTYRVLLWPDASAPVDVLKAWNPPE